MVADVNHLHVKRIHLVYLVDFSYSYRGFGEYRMERQMGVSFKFGYLPLVGCCERPQRQWAKATCSRRLLSWLGFHSQILLDKECLNLKEYQLYEPASAPDSRGLIS
jgi:hypothetical protein